MILWCLDVPTGCSTEWYKLGVAALTFNPFPAKVVKIRPGARLSRDRLPCDSPIEATTPF